MAKKTKTTKAKPSDASKPTRRSSRAPMAPTTTEAPQAAEPAPADATGAAQPRERDPRLPPVGTVLQKLARDGSVRCECTVDADGIRYAGKLYRSLSGAAMAAAKDLGLSNKTANGWNFWGITKPARHGADPVEALGRAWERYRERATAVVGAVKDDDRQRVRDVLGEHAQALKDLRGKVA